MNWQLIQSVLGLCRMATGGLDVTSTVHPNLAPTVTLKKKKSVSRATPNGLKCPLKHFLETLSLVQTQCSATFCF